MKHNDLFLLSYIFSSDDDGNPVEDVFAGFDEAFNLVVLIEHKDYDFPEYDSCAYAIVKKEDAYELAKRHKLPMTDLPGLIGASVDQDYYEIVNPSIRQTQNCFHEILAYLSHERCRFKLVRIKGESGYCCY